MQVFQFFLLKPIQKSFRKTFELKETGVESQIFLQKLQFCEYRRRIDENYLVNV